MNIMKHLISQHFIKKNFHKLLFSYIVVDSWSKMNDRTFDNDGKWFRRNSLLLNCRFWSLYKCLNIFLFNQIFFRIKWNAKLWQCFFFGKISFEIWHLFQIIKDYIECETNFRDIKKIFFCCCSFCSIEIHFVSLLFRSKWKNSDLNQPTESYGRSNSIIMINDL